MKNYNLHYAELKLNSDIPMFEFILSKMPSMGFKSDTFIQEYESFEEAYKVALDMVETKPLCYS